MKTALLTLAPTSLAGEEYGSGSEAELGLGYRIGGNLPSLW